MVAPLVLRHAIRWPKICRSHAFQGLGNAQQLPLARPRRAALCFSRTMSSSDRLTGQSGAQYLIERTLQDKEVPHQKVYLASAGGKKFVLKEVYPKDAFSYYEAMHQDLQACPYVRPVTDNVPEHLLLVFNYLDDHLLGLAQKNLPLPITKTTLKDALRGLAALHARNIVHTDIKADNILVNYEDDVSNRTGLAVKQVQLTDLEDAAYVPPGRHIRGKQVGNWMWRSPEGHASGSVEKPSDMFSFGLVCIYAVHKRVIFAVGDDELEEGVERLAVVIERQMSYFADPDSLEAFLKHLGDDNPWTQVFKVTRSSFNAENPRTPFSLWKGVEADFKDLIAGLTNFDPAQRLTAREALQHKWFADV